jgi:ABC-type microcin C transport system permease subunit YejE
MAAAIGIIAMAMVDGRAEPSRFVARSVYAWKMSVLFADFSFAGALSLFAVLLGAMALAKTQENEILHPGKRMLELLILALPMMLCLFIMGILLVHG